MSETYGGALNVLAAQVHATAKEKGFWDEDRNDGECIALMHSELSEGLEALRKGDMVNLSEELADTIIRILDYSAARGIDIGTAVTVKMAVNKDRPRKHGKRF